MAPSRVVLLTDFGTADGYAAAMAGVIAAAAPDARVEHASHDIAPGDVLGAAITLFRYADRYPPGTVHLVVVDPGVGTARRALAARLDGRFFVAPDNGLLSLELKRAREARVVALDGRGLPPDPAPTFHGRDLFAPAAALLATGVTVDDLGPAVDDPVRLDLPDPAMRAGVVEGAVLHADRFGNLITNIPATMVSTGARVLVGGREAGPVRRTYGDVEPGGTIALIGSLGLLEVSVRDGSAAHALDAGRGVVVLVRAR